jgi:hypothetical protein
MVLGADGPHVAIIVVCQYIGLTCMIVLTTLVGYEIAGMWRDVQHARQSTGGARMASIRFSIAKLSCCLLTLITCALFCVGPFYGTSIPFITINSDNLIV